MSGSLERPLEDPHRTFGDALLLDIKVLYPGLSSLYEPGGVQMLLTLKVSERDDAKPFEPGIDILTRVVAARAREAGGEWSALLIEEQLRRVCLKSGGHLRDLLRVLADVLRRVPSLPAADEVVERSLSTARNEFLPIADEDARWLAQIANEHGVALSGVDKLAELARFLDTHLVLCYRNGEEWYDVHPLIRDTVLSQAEPRAE